VFDLARKEETYEMTVQLYDVPTVRPLHLPSQHTEKASWQEYERLVVRLGMDAQQNLARQQLLNRDRPTIVAPPFTAAEREIWAAWLPDSWRGKAGLKEYNISPIPDAVLQRMHDLSAAQIFDEFELRTRWAPRECAILGIRDGKTWLLSRWSTYESLKPWGDIFRSAKERVEADATPFWALAILLCTVALVTLLITFRLLSETKWTDAIPGFVLAGFAFLGSAGCWMDRKDALWRAVALLGKGARQDS